jgi:teichuronic acid biosynthesis glycosyltransferase TuaC
MLNAPGVGVAGAAAERDLSVVALSSLFPNPLMPAHGIFLQHRLQHLAQRPGIEVRVVAPVPWFPFPQPRFGRYGAYARVPATATAGGLPVWHPRFMSIPKLGTPVTATAMALSVARQLRAFRREGFAFDVIDAYYLYPDGVAAALLGQWFGVPVVLTAFGSDVSQLPQYPLLRRQIAWSLRQASGMTAVCTALADGMRELDPGAEVAVVLHGVDLALFRPAADRAAGRAEQNIVSPTLLSVGHLIPRKGHGIAIEALRLLPPETNLLIVGQGPLEAELIAQARAQGVADRVRFRGYQPQPKLAALMGAVDALVLCSDREGIANVLLESMACGTPVVATPIWGTPELVEGAPGSVLAAARTPEAIAEGVRQLLATPIDHAAVRRYAERFTWAATAEQHEAVLLAVAARRAPPGRRWRPEPSPRRQASGNLCRSVLPLKFAGELRKHHAGAVRLSGTVYCHLGWQPEADRAAFIRRAIAIHAG